MDRISDRDRSERRLRELERHRHATLNPEVAGQGQRELLKALEMKVYSQNGEDGITVHLMAKVASDRRRFVEIGVEDGRECNTAYLSLEQGWSGILIEAEPRMAEAARRYYEQLAPGRVSVHSGMATPESINQVLADHGFEGEVDLLSIDIDSFDYYLWKSIERINPRVVIMEYNAYYGPHRCVTIPLEDRFDRFDKHFSGYYWGASLRALEKLGQAKGFSLVGCDSNGANAFFVRQDLLARSGLKALSAEQAYYPLRSRRRREAPEVAFARIKHLPLVEV